MPVLPRHPAVWVLLVAALLRIALALGSSPVLSDDIWRYIFDGQTFAAGHNPYHQSPLDAADGEPLVNRINHPHLVSIYQPTSQWVFAELYRLAGPSVTGFRLGFVMLDLLVVALLVVMLQQAGRSAWWAAVYGWHPLAVVETAWSGHQDVIGIALLLGAVAQAGRLRDRPTGEGRLWPAALAGALFALAVGVKPLVLPVGLFLLIVLGKTRSGRLNGQAIGGFCIAAAGMLAVLYLPFTLMRGGLGGMLETVRIFTSTWAFNGTVQPAMQWLLGDAALSRQLCALALLAVVGVLGWRLWRRAAEADERALPDPLAAACGWYFLIALLLSSTVHPWYLLWALVFVPLAVNLATLVFSVTIFLAYLALVLGTWRLPWWVLGLEYGPVAAALVMQAWWGRTSGRLPRQRGRAIRADDTAHPPPD